jgi:F-type H+-transporting ATPase subunit delta
VRPSTTARRYAEAAFEVARQGGDTEGWLDDLKMASGVVQAASVSRYFKDPETGRREQLETLNGLFGNLRPQVLNLLRILATRHRMYLLPSVTREFEHLDRQARGIAEARVTTARPIEEAEREKIAERLGRLTGKIVDIHTAIDPSILGGFVVRIGDRLIDASIAGRLERLRQEMTA